MALPALPPDTPVSPALAGWLRARVLLLRQSGKRQRFPEQLELVSTAPSSAKAPALLHRANVEVADDHALRVELLSRLLSSVESAASGSEGQPGHASLGIAMVHVRPGPPELCDSDIAWLAAARCQAGMTAPAIFQAIALTRWGWLDLASGEGRTWVRLRH